MVTNLNEIIERYKNANPEQCQFLGIQSTYGKVPSYDQQYIVNRIKEIKNDLKYIKNLQSNKNYNENSELELETIHHYLELELFNREERKEYLEKPTDYVSVLSSIQQYYITRSYAPLEVRIKHIIETEKGIPYLIEQAYKNLKKKLPKKRIEITFLEMKPLLGYLRDELIESLVQLENKELLEEWSQINVQTIEAVEKFLEKLESEYLPNADEVFALGETKYLKLLEKSEGIHITVDKLLEISEKDLERNFQEIQRIQKELGPKEYQKLIVEYPIEEELLQTAEKTIRRFIVFVEDKDLLTFLTSEKCTVKETPSTMKAFIFAAMNTSNIGEESEATESYYYITPPDKKWTEEERKNYMKMFNKGVLEDVTGHEVIPGHFLHMQHIKKQTPIIRLLGLSETTLEGWAHYTEELLIEQKYDKIEPILIHIGQLLAALVRNCRFVVSIKMHCKGMTVEEAQKLFMEKGLITEKAALMEARRGTFDPLFLSYTLGKLIIIKLREDYKKEQGSEYSIKKFHDTLLSYGAIPLIMIRKRMLMNPGREKDIL